MIYSSTCLWEPCHPNAQSTDKWCDHPAYRRAYPARRPMLFSYAYATAATQQSRAPHPPAAAETHPEPWGRASDDHPPDPKSAEPRAMKTPTAAPCEQSANGEDPQRRNADNCYPDSE